jgi:hypothetical protein
METGGIETSVDVSGPGPQGTSVEFFTTVPEATRGALGVASLAPVTTALVDLATQLFGEPPRFWGRAFGASDGDAHTLDESAILRTRNIRVLPVSRRGARVRLGLAEGLSDGEADARDLVTQLGKANLVSQGGEVFLFLSVEPTDPLSTAYFEGWAAGLGCASSSVTVHPCVRMAQTDDRTLTAILAAHADGVACRGAWIFNPPDPRWKDRRKHEPGPFRPDKVELSAPLPCPVLLWQYADRYQGTLDCLMASPSLDVESDLLDYLPLPPSAAEPPDNPSVEPDPDLPDPGPNPAPRPRPVTWLGTWLGPLLASPWSWVLFIGGALAMIGVGLIPHLRGGLVWALDAAILGGMIALIGVAVTGRPLGVLVSAQNRMSLSRFQIVLWTLVLLSAYVAIVARRLRLAAPMDIEIDARLWALMGLSTATLLGTPALQAKKKADGALCRNDSLEEAWFSDMFGSDDAGSRGSVDLSKVQMFCLTLVAVVSYGVSLFRLIDGTAPEDIKAFPELTTAFLAILGLSHAGYLAGKLTPEKPAPDEPEAPSETPREAKAEPSKPTEPGTSTGDPTPASPDEPVEPARPVEAPAARHAIPPRPADALTGSAFFAKLGSTVGQAREDLALEQILAGNIPNFLRNFVEIELQAGGRRASVWVSPDVLSIGSDEDFVRMPLNPLTAQQVHDRYRTTFVTTKLADDVHAHADVALAAITRPPGPEMVMNPYFLEHNASVEQDRRKKDPTLGRLVSTVKKDVCLSILLKKPPSGKSLGSRSVVIYGWYKSSSKDSAPWQPESTVHENTYVDYSHGIRLVSTEMVVDGKPMSLFDVMEDKALAPLLLKAADVRSPLFPPPRRYEAAPRRAPAATPKGPSTKQGGGTATQPTTTGSPARQASPNPARQAPPNPARQADPNPARQAPPNPARQADPVDSPARQGSSSAMAPALLQLRRQIDARWPARDRASDGILGDASHQARPSDHNQGNAFDITYDPENGPDLDALADLFITDPRVHYVIWNRRIRNRQFQAGEWRPYGGPGKSPHTNHLHVSVFADRRDDTTPFRLP